MLRACCSDDPYFLCSHLDHNWHWTLSSNPLTEGETCLENPNFAVWRRHLILINQLVIQDHIILHSHVAATHKSPPNKPSHHLKHREIKKRHLSSTSLISDTTCWWLFRSHEPHVTCPLLLRPHMSINIHNSPPVDGVLTLKELLKPKTRSSQATFTIRNAFLFFFMSHFIEGWLVSSTSLRDFCDIGAIWFSQVVSETSKGELIYRDIRYKVFSVKPVLPNQASFGHKVTPLSYI